MRVFRRVGPRAGISAVAMLLVPLVAGAVSVLLPPGGSLNVPSTTAATEPDLAGVVINDTLVPFTIKNPAGEVICEGQLQDRVVKSNATGRLEFSYRIRDTNGSGSIARISTARFGGLRLRVAWAADGLGTVAPVLATRSAPPGAVVRFVFRNPPVSCAEHQESRFMLIKTPATEFRPGGTTVITATTGLSVSVPTVIP